MYIVSVFIVTKLVATFHGNVWVWTGNETTTKLKIEVLINYIMPSPSILGMLTCAFEVHQSVCIQNDIYTSESTSIQSD